MPTIPEIKAELKALGVKGITGKNKAELMAMLEQAKAPKEAPKKKGPKIYRKPEIGDVSEPPIIAPKKKGPRIAPKKPEIGEDGLAELLGIIAKSVAGRPVPVKAEPDKPSKKEVEDFVKSELVRIDQTTKARAEAPRLTPAERHERDRLEHVKWREKVAEDLRKSQQEMLQRNAQNAKEQAERLALMGIKKASPPPIIPWNIKEKMRYNLARDYDLHEYKIGLAHPIDDMIKWFRRLADRDNSTLASVAERFLSELTKWVRENSHERPSWGDKDKTERVLLLSDWEDFFKANR